MDYTLFKLVVFLILILQLYSQEEFNRVYRSRIDSELSRHVTEGDALHSLEPTVFRESRIGCTEGYYRYGKLCLKCYPTCSKCYGPTEQECNEVNEISKDTVFSQKGIISKLRSTRILQEDDEDNNKDLNKEKSLEIGNGITDNSTYNVVIETESFFNKTFSLNTQVFSRIVGLLALVHNAIQPDNPGPLMSILLSKLCIRIIKIKLIYPWHVAQVFNSQGYIDSAVLLDLGFLMNEDEVLKATNVTNFEANSGNIYHPGYLASNWRNIFTFLAIMTAIVILNLLQLLLYRINFISRAIIKLKAIFSWNTFLIVFISSIQESLYYSIKEINSPQFNTHLGVINFILSVASIGSIIFLLGFIYKIAKKRVKDYNFIPSKFSSTLNTGESSSGEWRNCQVLYKGFKRHPLMTQCFLIFIIMRVILFDIMLFYLEDYPTTQITLNALYTTFVALYVIFKKPFIRRPNYIQGSVFQSLTVLSMFGMFAIDIVDHTNLPFKKALLLKEIAGYFILLVLLFLTCALKLSIIVGFLIAIHGFYIKFMNKRNTQSQAKTNSNNSIKDFDEKRSRLTGIGPIEVPPENNEAEQTSNRENKSWKKLRLVGNIDAVFSNNTKEDEQEIKPAIREVKGRTKKGSDGAYYQQEDQET